MAQVNASAQELARFDFETARPVMQALRRARVSQPGVPRIGMHAAFSARRSHTLSR